MGQGRLVCEPLGAPQLREFVKLWRPSQSDQTPQVLGSIRPHRVTFRAFSRTALAAGDGDIPAELLGEDQIDLLSCLVEQLDCLGDLLVSAGLADLLSGVHQARRSTC